MSIFDFFKQKKPKIVSEIERQDFLRRNGRICEGMIVDSETAENGDEIVHYFYCIQGVDFQSAEILTEEQRRNPLKYAPGAKVGVRFDPKNHGNSMLD